MTVAELSFYIFLGFLTQAALFGGIALYRHFRTYDTMEAQLTDLGVAPAPVPPRPPVGPGWEGFRPFRVVRKTMEDRARTVCSFHLAPLDGGPLPVFMPGQYLTFRIDHPAEAKPLLRCYSLSDRPGLDHYRVSVKRVDAAADGMPPGRGSSHFHDRLREGDVIDVRAPAGHFFLEPGTGPVVLIAGGIGLTPLLSMVNATVEAASGRAIWLFYGVRNSAEHVMKEHLESLARTQANLHLRVCYSRPLPEDREGIDYHHKGHVDTTLLRLTLPLRPFHFYVCGSPAMMESIVAGLDAWGVPERHIHFEAFGPASVKRPNRQGETTPATATVTFSKSGKSVAWDGAASLLELAERHRIAVESGCRAGGCGACETVIEDGEVAYEHDPDYTPAAGSCLLCVSRPRRDVTLAL